ncbi:oxygen-dependent protoporphyrinogen oxidase [Entomortierella beljakovae]|nr:oxygen-dependent protoporphyrinogen oxidase [Entomortierella beljakovae]
MPPRTHIAVIGGGISGLSTAWYLARTAPSNVAITLLEGSKRIGGWLHSDRIDDPHNPGGSILLERGPRSLRPQGISGLNTLEMIKLLGIESKLEPILKTSPAAKNRFIYSRDKLHMLPSSISGAITHPLLAPKIPRAGLDLIKGASGEEDESIESFVTRRFGKGISDDLISAMVHGIYAGDVSKLSVRSTFGILYHLEKEYGSVVLGLLMGGGAVETPWDLTLQEKLLADMPETKDFLKSTSIYSFTNGLQELSDALEKDLTSKGRVTIRKDTFVSKLNFNPNSNTAEIQINGQDPVQANIVISAIPSRQLHGLLPKNHPELVYNPSATVAVVNLVYRAEQASLPSPGFGYLVPRSENSAAKHQGLLGVVFDSCAIPSQDLGPSRDSCLKLTAMVGGHMFDQVVKDQSNEDLESFFKNAAINAVEKHLQIKSQPEIANVHIHRECIPQYMVGHLQRMQTLDQDLREEYNGMLAVTGAGYLGVSVNDCIKNAREVAEAVVSKLEEIDDGEAELVGKQDTVTGLERSWFM